ncbi:putative WD40-repeat-containing domain superfamily [Helianthus annuus]|nr:putative WD40-repeat-containing domain superfamily [Helianthus annuus]
MLIIQKLLLQCAQLNPTEPYVLSGGKDKYVVLWSIHDHIFTSVLLHCYSCLETFEEILSLIIYALQELLSSRPEEEPSF